MEELIFGDILKYMLIFGVVELILAFLNWIIFRKNKPIYLRHTFFIGGASFGCIYEKMVNYFNASFSKYEFW